MSGAIYHCYAHSGRCVCQTVKHYAWQLWPYVTGGPRSDKVVAYVPSSGSSKSCSSMRHFWPYCIAVVLLHPAYSVPFTALKIQNTCNNNTNDDNICTTRYAKLWRNKMRLQSAAEQT